MENLNYIEHEYRGKVHALSFTAGALYRIYDKFGYDRDLIRHLEIDQNTLKSWENTCWVYALLAHQGELQRRAAGEEAHPFVQYEELHTGAMPAEVVGLKEAIYEAMAQGWRRTQPADEDAELDLVLQDIEDAEKKKADGVAKDLASSLLAFVSSVCNRQSSGSSSPESSPTSSKS